MNLLDRLEKPLGWMTIGHLPIYVVTAQAILYLWVLVNPEASSLMILDPVSLRDNHEYWRMLTFLFLIPFQNPFFAFFYLYFQYVCGTALEEEWGSFPLTVFYLVGVIGAVVAAFLVGTNMGNRFYLNETIFLAFAAVHPNFQLLLFFVLPVKVKWIAWLVWANIIFGFIGSSWLWKVAILVSLSNYLLFFAKPHVDHVQDAFARWRHRRRYRDWPD